MDHSKISIRELGNSKLTDLTKLQRKILVDKVLHIYFTSQENTPSAISTALGFKHQLVKRILDIHIVQGADLKAMRRHYTSLHS